ncbi:CHASE domain-containing protein [Phenylobacterium sp. J426]|uniref:CHASE domain-containing protein n=1 Tax=Phenylobacterium sp. J426 TaxID=2898439 RepID=UPI002150C109|nr:CHASE domain-containing protein [Phenylobacterium sp. J426]MCR5876614.1 CHASE domain-containing protein [Phenylobacterium sp. J426]
MFDDLETDALTELVNIAVSGAATRLGGMVGSLVELSVPAISVASSAEARETLVRLGLHELVAVRQVFDGAVAGETLLVFPDASLPGLLRAVIGEDVSADAREALADDALKEIGNVVLMGFLSTIGNMLRRDFDVGLPQTVEGAPSDLFAAADGAVLLIYMNFSIAGVHVRGYFAMVLGLSSLAALRLVVREFLVRTGGSSAASLKGRCNRPSAAQGRRGARLMGAVSWRSEVVQSRRVAVTPSEQGRKPYVGPHLDSLLQVLSERAVHRRRLLTLTRHQTLAGVTLLVGVLATLLVAGQLWQAGRAKDDARFEAEVDLAIARLADRIETHIALLRGGVGLFAGSDEVTARDFADYAAQLGLGSRYAGVLGIGYSEVATGEAERRALERQMRGEGLTDFKVWPAGPRPIYHSIVFLSPLNDRNRAALGYDMFTEPTRRAAMAKARDSGQAAASGRVLLVQEIEARKQPGFLIYLPVYAEGVVPASPSERARRLRGFVYSPLRTHDLLGAVFPSTADRLVDVAIYDGVVRQADLLYATALEPGRATRQTVRSLDVGGRTWAVVVQARPGFASSSAAPWAAGAGLLLTLVLAGASFAQGRSAASLEQAREDLQALAGSLETRVEDRTRELAGANAVLQQEMRRRESAEAQVRQMQKIEAIGQLTGGIAHDFNNMLAVIVGSLDMARRRLTGDEDARIVQCLANASEGASRAAMLTARLLAFSRQQPLSPMPIDANKLVSGMSELLRRSLGEQVRVETVLAGGLWRTYADAGELENAILNLAVNARDAMPDGGRLTIETLNTHLDEAYAAAHSEVSAGQYVTICLTDTGTGMTPEVAERAFDPFYTTKGVGKGTGLGLSQVYGFVKQSGGHVKIYSEPGEGTTIKVYLPRWFGPDAKMEAQAERSELPLGRPEEIILVVEDEAQVRHLSVDVLRELGYTVVQASDGAQALEQLAIQPRVDLLFTDIVMPDMNGRRLAEQALAARPTLKVLYTTGYTRNAVVHNGMLDLDVAFLSKPFTVEQLARKVRQVLDGQGANRTV